MSKPEGMTILDNINMADSTHPNDWIPEGAFLTVSTSDPQNTQFVDVEVFVGQNLDEIAQIDPEFDHKTMIVLKLKRGDVSMKGKAKIVVAWADASDEEYSETRTFDIV